MGENADHKTLGSQVLLSGEIAAKSQNLQRVMLVYAT